MVGIARVSAIAVVTGHVGDVKILVQVKSSDTFDGSFRVELTLLGYFPIREAYAGVDNWGYSTCPDAGSDLQVLVNRDRKPLGIVTNSGLFRAGPA